MNTTTLLRQAPVGAVLVRRPHGVTHIYVGPLTPSGRMVPEATGRAVCRQRTRRLYVVDAPKETDFDPRAPRACRRCVAVVCKGKAATATPTTRGDWLATYGDLTPFDLAVDAWMAETPDEIDRVQYLALLIVGWPAVDTSPVVSPTGRSTRPLTAYLADARRRVGHLTDRAIRLREKADAEAAAAAAKEARVLAAIRAHKKSS